jgi:hypothetical protein
MLSVLIPNVVMQCHNAEFQYPECRYTECHYAECRGTV